MKKFLSVKFITLSYLVVLLLGALLPLNSGVSLNENYTMHIRWDYLLHAMVYLPLPILLGLYLKLGNRNKVQQINSTQFWIWIALVALSIAAALEAIQLFVPYRAFNINDLVANGVGVVLGLLLISIPAVRRLFSSFKS